MPATTGPQPIDGVQMPTWLQRFDKRGICSSPLSRQALLDHIGARPPSDIVFFSHGWNNDAQDATSLYGKFLRAFEAHVSQHPPQRAFEPLFVGVLWPSIWLSFGDEPQIAGTAAPLGGLQPMADELADRVAAAGGEAALPRLYELIGKPALGAAEAAELARLVAPSFGAIADEGAAPQGRDTAAADVLAMMGALQEAAGRGARAPASDDLDDFSRPAGAAAAPTRTPGVQAAGLASLLDPRAALRLLSIYQMKDRAGSVGFNGVSALLHDVLVATQAAPGASATRVHAVGHSFGCKVMLSAVCAQPLPRPLASALLLQPAISHLSFAEAVSDDGPPGGYRDALKPDRISAPIFATYSRNDFPLHGAFHLAVRRASDLGEAQIAAAGAADSTTAGPPPSRFAALGGYGPRRAKQWLVDPLPRAGTAYPTPPAGTRIVAFDGSQGVIGSHGDIAGADAAWALHRLVFG